MKKQLLTIFGIAAMFANSTAQEQQKKSGLYPIPCNTYSAMDEVFDKDANAKLRYNLVQSQLENEYRQEILNQASQKVGAVPIYTIPVVFHILHQNERNFYICIVSVCYSLLPFSYQSYSNSA